MIHCAWNSKPFFNSDPKKPMSDIWEPLTLVNVVVTGTATTTFDLNMLSKNIFNCEYFPKKFAAMKMVRSNPFSKALVFRSGKFVCVGASSIEGAFDSLNWFAEQVRKVMNSDFTLHETKVQNMVASTKMFDETKSVRLSTVFDTAPDHAQYEPQVK